jgi:C4-dicarboxylate transporter, DctM subunit
MMVSKIWSRAGQLFPEASPDFKERKMISKILTRVEQLFSNISGLFILVMMVLTTVDVFLRDFFNSPIKGNFELQTLMIPAVAYLGVSYVQSRRGHIVMDVLISRLSPASQFIFQLLGDAIFLIIAALITWRMSLQALQAQIIGDYYWGIVHIPIAPTKWAITLGMGLVCLRLIYGIITNQLWKKRPGQRSREYYARLIATIIIFILVGIAIVTTGNLDLSTTNVGWVSLGLFMVLLLCGTPIAASMALIGVWGFWVLKGTSSALGMAGGVPFTASAEYSMTVLPLFIVMGSFAALAGFAQAGFELGKRWLERLPGGIVQATVVGATAFAASTGSGIASCAVLTKIAYPEMMKAGVNKGMAIGVIASASTLAIMIPPSGQFVVYGMLTGTSVGKLLIAGIIPGLIGAAMIMTMIFIRCKIDPKIAGAIISTTPWKERFLAIPRAWGILLIALIIIGGLYTGIFTPTEAGAVGAFMAFIAMFATRKAGWNDLVKSLLESGAISGTLLFILVGGIMFGNMIGITRLPNMLSEWIVSLNIPPIAILIGIMLMYLVLGCFTDTLSTMIITLPIIFPIIIKLGFSPIWFGVLMVQNAEIGGVTPPFGMGLFVLKSLIPNTALGEIFRAVGWFIVPLVATMVIYIAFPQVALWLPDMMMK